MATPSVYQRVGNAAVTPSDYDSSVGKVYLRFNGTNQWLQTNSIDFTGTSKLMFSCGVLANSKAEYQMIAAHNGTPVAWIYLYNTGASKFFESTTTNNTFNANANANFPGPVVSTTIFDRLGATLNDRLKIRVNGAQPALTYPNQGGTSGNFGNGVLYIGKNASDLYWIDGNLYQLVIAGKQASAAEITSTETYLNQKTGAF